MLEASNLKPGIFIKKDNDIFKVLEAEIKTGQARFSSHVYAKLQNVRTGKPIDIKLVPEEKIEDISLEILSLEYLYSDGENYCFMNPQTYEQFEVPSHMIGNFKKFLKEGLSLKFEIYEGLPVNIIIPETVELKVINTGTGLRGNIDATYKSALLENNIEIMVPQFIKVDDIIKISTTTAQYIERVHK